MCAAVPWPYNAAAFAPTFALCAEVKFAPTAGMACLVLVSKVSFENLGFVNAEVSNC